MKLALILVGAPLLLRLLVFLELSGSPFFECLFIDARIYHVTAERLALGNLPMQAPFWQPPFYATFVSWIYQLFGSNPDAVRLVQILLGSLSCCWLFRIGDRLFGRVAAWVAWGGMTLYGPFLFFDLQLLNVTLGTFLFLSTLVLIPQVALVSVRASVSVAGRWLAVGILAGASAITIGNMAVLLPVLAIWLVSAARVDSKPTPQGKGDLARSGVRTKLRAVAFPLVCLVVGWSAAVAPIAVANYRVSGEFIPISYNGGINFWIGNNPDYDRTVAIRPGRAWRALTSEPFENGKSSFREQSQYFFEKSGQWIVEDPVAYLALLGKKAGLFLRGDEIARNQEIYPFRADSIVLRVSIWIAGLGFPFGLLLPFAMFGIVATTLGRASAGGNGNGSASSASASGAGLHLALLAIYSMTIVAFFVTSRYRLPMVPLLLLFAGAGISRLPDRNRRLSGRLMVAVGVAFAAAIASVISLPAMPRTFNSDAHYDLGLSYQTAGDPGRARIEYERALQIDPKNYEAMNNLAGLHFQEGQFPAARPHLEAILGAFPNDVRAMNNLALIHLESGDPAVALRLSERAIAIEPRNPKSQENLRRARERLRDND